MNYDKYKNQVELPKGKAEWSRERRRQIDEERMTTAERNEALSQLDDGYDEYKREQYQTHHVAEQKARIVFFEDAFEELGLGFLPDSALKKLEALAWERGHSGGFPEIMHELEEMHDIVRHVYADGYSRGKAGLPIPITFPI